METEVESLYCRKFYRGEIPLHEVAESNVTKEGAQACVALQQSFGPHGQESAGNIFQDTENKLEKTNQGQWAKTDAGAQRKSNSNCIL